MTAITERLDRLEAQLEDQQETVQSQQEQIEAQAETIESQRDRLEEQEAIIARQRERLAELDEDDGDVIMNRRTAIQAGGVLGLIGVGAGAASADPQGRIGTETDPLEALHTRDVKSDGSLGVDIDSNASSGTESFTISEGDGSSDLLTLDQDGQVTIPNGNLDLSGNDLSNVASINGGVTGNTEITDLVGNGLTINSGTLEAAAGKWQDADADSLLEPSGSETGIEGLQTIGAGSGNGLTVTTDGSRRALELGYPADDGTYEAGGNLVAGHPNNGVRNGALGAVVGGGGSAGSTGANEAYDNYAMLGGGRGNQVGSDDNDAGSAEEATVAGGAYNEASARGATVGGGAANTASGRQATVPGGISNTADGKNSFAAGQSADTNGNDGAFVWGDSSTTSVTATAADSARFQVPGGFTIQDGTLAVEDGNLDLGKNKLTNAAAITGGVTGNTEITDLVGSGLTINSGSLEATGGSSLWEDAGDDGLLNPNDAGDNGIGVTNVETDTLTDNGSGSVTMGNTLDLDGNNLDNVASIDNDGSAISVDDALNLSASDSIQDSGTDAIAFDGSQNVTIPNGRLSVSEIENGGGNYVTLKDSTDINLDGNELTDRSGDMSITSVNGVNIDLDNDQTGSGDNWDFSVTKDGEATSLFTVNDGGEVDIENGTLDLNGNNLNNVASIDGGVTGNNQITELDGTGLSISSGSLTVSEVSRLVTAGNSVEALQVVDGNTDVLNEDSSADAPNVIAGHPDNNTGSASPTGATISGGGSAGDSNEASANNATVGGGENNTASGNWSTVGGGSDNTADGVDATIPGGTQNDASGYQSFAAGLFAKAADDNAFVWNDGSGSDNPDATSDDQFSSSTTTNLAGAPSGAETFSVKAKGGVRFVTSDDNTSHAYVDSSGNVVASNNLDAQGGTVQNSGGPLTLSTNSGNLSLNPEDDIDAKSNAVTNVAGIDNGSSAINVGDNLDLNGNTIKNASDIQSDALNGADTSSSAAADQLLKTDGSGNLELDDAVTGQNASYVIQKDGTDGSGVINFKTS